MPTLSLNLGRRCPHELSERGRSQLGRRLCRLILNLGQKINFSKDYCLNLLQVYREDDRQFLGRDNGINLILRWPLLSLAQIRLLRVTAVTKFISLENKLDSIIQTVNNPTDRDKILASLNRVHEKLESAERSRQSTVTEFQARHSTLILCFVVQWYYIKSLI